MKRMSHPCDLIRQPMLEYAGLKPDFSEAAVSDRGVICDALDLETARRLGRNMAWTPCRRNATFPDAASDVGQSLQIFSPQL